MTERRISYAQNGEDIVLARAFGGSDGFYVDVGANEPTHDSVTRLFYERGWRGVNVEPQPDCFVRLCAERPADVNVAVGVGSKPGRLVFYYVPDAPGMSTMSAVRAEQLWAGGYATEQREVEVVMLDDLFAEHVGDRTVDFLKVDVEGLEDEVLGGFDWTRWRPRAVVVESSDEVSTWERRLVEHGYRRTLWDGINVFFVRDEDAAELGPALSIPATTVLDSYDPWIYVEQLRRAATNCAEQLDQAQAAYESQLTQSSATYESQLTQTRAGYEARLADAAAANDVLTEEYLALALCELSGPVHATDAQAAGRALGRALLVRPDVRDRYGDPPQVDLAALLRWATGVASDEPHVAELVVHRATYERLARRAASQTRRPESVARRAGRQLMRVQRDARDRLDRARGRR